MKVILLAPVKGLGNTGQTVNVKPGFARNYLFPNRIAIAANATSARAIEHQKRLVDVRVAQEKKAAEGEAERLATASCSIARHVGEEDKLFGSVTARDIAESLQAQGFKVDHTQVLLEEPIKFLGVYQVPVKLVQDIEAKVKVWVVAQ
jgi:large subunit ribosomal protein L9